MIDSRFYDLLRHLWRGGSYGYFWTPDDGAGQKLTWWRGLGDDPAAIVVPDVPRFFHDRDAYFGVHPAKRRRSEHERARVDDDDIAAVNCFFAEFDAGPGKPFTDKAAILAHLQTLPVQPSVNVDSGGGIHGYWYLDKPYTLDWTNREEVRRYQMAWVALVGGDDGAKDLARVLRIPGTFNRKHEYNFPQVQIVGWEPDRVSDLGTLLPLLQPHLEALHNAQKVHAPHARGKPSAAVSLDDQTLLDAMFRSRNGDLYRRLWDGDLAPAGGDHSKADMMLSNGLAWVTGRDISRMDSLFRQSGLMRDKWRDRDDYRDRTLDQAARSAQTVYDPHYVDPAAMAAAQSVIGNGNGAGHNGNGAGHGGGGGGTGGNAGGSGPQPQPPSDDQFLLAQGANDEGNAQSVYRLHGQHFLFTPAYGYLLYTGSHWETDGAEAALTDAVVNTLERRALLALRSGNDVLLRAAKPSATNVRNTMYLFQRLITANVATFDADPELLNCANGVVNLRTGYLSPHSPSQRFTYVVPVEYDPSADCVDWIEFLERVTPSPEIVDYLQMAVGYSLTGDTREECMWYIYGPSRSGKGTFAETLLHLLPMPLGVQADFATFTAERKGDVQNFDLAPLKPARLVIASESNKYETLNEAKIKTATGGDWIRCAFKHRDHFTYRPQFKIWLLSNHPVRGDVDDDAFWGRLRTVDFPNSFLGKEDKTLKRRMREPANLAGVLAWAVEGAKRWYALAHGLKTPAAVTQSTQARRAELDFVQQWLDDCCKVNATAWTANSAIRQSYRDWCVDHGVTPKQMEQLTRALARKGFDVGVRKYLPNGKQTRGISGLLIV